MQAFFHPNQNVAGVLLRRLPIKGVAEGTEGQGMNRTDLAFARVASNYLLGGSACFALVALMRIWINDGKQQGRDRG